MQWKYFFKPLLLTWCFFYKILRTSAHFQSISNQYLYFLLLEDLADLYGMMMPGRDYILYLSKQWTQFCITWYKFSSFNMWSISFCKFQIGNYVESFFKIP